MILTVCTLLDLLFSLNIIFMRFWFFATYSNLHIGLGFFIHSVNGKWGMFLVLLCFLLLLVKFPEYSCTYLFMYMCKNSRVYSQKLNHWVIESTHLYQIMSKCSYKVVALIRSPIIVFISILSL